MAEVKCEKCHSQLDALNLLGALTYDGITTCCERCLGELTPQTVCCMVCGVSRGQYPLMTASLNLKTKEGEYNWQLTVVICSAECANKSPQIVERLEARMHLASLLNGEEVADDEEQLACEHCGNFGELKRCSRCKIVYYCSVECQRTHWKSHRSNCQQI